MEREVTTSPEYGDQPGDGVRSGDGRIEASSDGYVKKPDWLRIRLRTTGEYRQVRDSVRSNGLHTVCEEAKCPNLQECWGTYKTATFMILGDTCTRRCRFCSVGTGLPGEVDIGEPARVAESAAEMGLVHVVLTMVNRDDLPDGGALMMANTVRAIRRRSAGTTVEVLSSDLMGDGESIDVLCASRPEIMSHNIETVRRLTPFIRSHSTYERSLAFLERAVKTDPGSIVKSSIMLGLGETKEEVLEAMDDLRSVGVRVINIGQYLQPSKSAVPVKKYWTPGEFLDLKRMALEKGFLQCDAGPLVRSSYHAGTQYAQLRRKLDGAAGQAR